MWEQQKLFILYAWKHIRKDHKDNKYLSKTNYRIASEIFMKDYNITNEKTLFKLSYNDLSLEEN